MLQLPQIYFLFFNLTVLSLWAIDSARPDDSHCVTFVGYRQRKVLEIGKSAVFARGRNMCKIGFYY